MCLTPRGMLAHAAGPLFGFGFPKYGIVKKKHVKPMDKQPMPDFKQDACHKLVLPAILQERALHRNNRIAPWMATRPLLLAIPIHSSWITFFAVLDQPKHMAMGDHRIETAMGNYGNLLRNGRNRHFRIVIANFSILL